MSRQFIASLSFFSHKREGDSDDIVHIMDAFGALFELICRQLCAKDLCCLSQTCRKLHSVVAAEHEARCEDFARGQEAVPVKVLWYVPFLYFCFSAMGAQTKKADDVNNRCSCRGPGYPTDLCYKADVRSKHSDVVLEDINGCSCASR